MKILLADDDDQLQRALRITLTARGYEVLQARDGAEAIDLAARTVRTADGDASAVRLTPTEWRLLELLLRNPGRLMTRQMLLNEVWGPYHANDGGYLRLYMAQLRRKLEPTPSAPRYLVTEPGMGYRFDP